jgi:hypothetical protein
MALGYKLEDENRVPTKEEAYQQMSHSASLLKAIIKYGEDQSKKKERDGASKASPSLGLEFVGCFLKRAGGFKLGVPIISPRHKNRYPPRV